MCHLQQIRYKGTRYKRLEDAGVITVNDLLHLLYTDSKRLEYVVTDFSLSFYLLTRNTLDRVENKWVI